MVQRKAANRKGKVGKTEQWKGAKRGALTALTLKQLQLNKSKQFHKLDAIKASFKKQKQNKKTHSLRGDDFSYQCKSTQAR